jgi:Protein of unknown function (DUF3352)
MVSPPPSQACAKRHALGPWLVGVLLGFLAASVVHAASPRDELLRFVPEDTAFCVVFQNLRTHWAALQNSPFAERFLPLSLGEANARDLQKLNELEKILEKHLGLTWDKVRNDLFGESVVFAYRPGPPGKAQEEQALFLLRSRNPKTLSDFIDRFNEAQRKSGELKELQQREHKGVRYYCRVETRETSYYYLRGPILVLSKQEERLKQALDCDQELPGDREPPLVRHLKQMEADGSLMTIWLNPRALDAAVAARGAKARPEDVGVHKTVAQCWKALDGLALSVHLDRDLALSLAVRARLEDMPAGMRKLLTQAGRQGELSRLFPEEPLFACAGRLDLVALLESLSEFLPEKSRRSLQADLDQKLGAPLGKNIVKDVLPYLGPDIGLMVVAPSPQDKGFTPHTLMALRMGVGDPSAPVDKAVFSGIQFLAQWVIFGHNWQFPEKPLALKTVTQQGREIRFLTGACFPPGVQPAFALHAGFLLLASSPEAISRFGPGGTAGANPPLKTVPLLRISIKAWRAYLKERREEFINHALVEKKDLNRTEAIEKLDQLQHVLEMFDRIELRQKTSPNLLVLTLSIQPSQPFMK